MLTICLYLLKLVSAFLIWTLLIYWLHRLAHVKNKYNFLYFIHRYHHRVNYLKQNTRRWRWSYLFFWFGSFQETIDVLLTLTLPALLIYGILPKAGIVLLIFHYFYEVFLSEAQLDHNHRIKGKITKYFSWGTYHLSHHKNVAYNYSLIITFWDFVFQTQKRTDL